MQKILIIAYFFPPCNLPASQRVYGWTNHLMEFGYYPIIVTRSWDKEIKTPLDAYKKSGNRLRHEKFPNYEVFYLPYYPNLRDKIYTKYGDSKYIRIRKLLTLFELFTQNFTNYFIPFKNIYKFSEEYLKNNNINKVIITANPFILLKFGYLLNKRLNVKWIADYRDEWTTQQLIIKRPLIQKLISKLESYFEKKWAGSSELITSVSEFYTCQIKKFVKKPGVVILNGYAEEDLNSDKLELFTDFTIVYNGTLYPTQKVELFLDAAKKLIDYNKKPGNIKLHFPGLAYDKIQVDRVSNYMKGYSEYIIITDRIPRNEVMEIQKKSHLLLLFSHSNSKGTTPSKLYEYISIKKPVLLCPNDHDIIESTLKKTGLGYFANTTDETYNILKKFYEDFSEQREIPITPDLKEIEALSRKNQTKKLSYLLKGLET